jgi:protein-tyrosine phosphatase
MIDIHSHILFGVDDGAAALGDSLALARIYEQAGYRQVVATPHAELDSLPFKNFGRSIRDAVNRLNQHLAKHHVEVKVLTGMEVGLDPKLPEMVAQGGILTLADTKYLLVETPFSQLPVKWWKIVFLLAARGITVIFAHPERCAQVAHSHELLERMVRSGVKFQVNWDSFSGAYGRGVANIARLMARKGFIHCLATDSHDAKNRHAGNVPAIAVQLEGLIGKKNLRRIAIENPNRVVHGKALLEMNLGEMPKLVRSKRIGGRTRFWPKLVIGDLYSALGEGIRSKF